MPKNKVKFGLKNVHYAPLTIAEDGSYSFSTPVRIPGAVNLSMEASGEAQIFYADCTAYYTTNNNSGYSGDLEIALIPDGFRKTILGETEDEAGVLVERSDAEFTPFALLFEFEGDKKHVRHAMYHCVASRPAIEGQTDEENKEVQTETLSLSSLPLPDGLVKAKTGENTTQNTYNNWYSAVHMPAAAQAAALLASITIGSLALSPSFSAHTTAYTASTSNAEDAVSATGASGVTATILVNGVAHTSGEDATWSSGANTVTVTASKAGCSSTAYTVTVTKEQS